MINFPVLESLEISGYDMFPSEGETPVRFDLTSQATVILGVNGLGKSTLIAMMFRLLTGPWDLPKIDSADRLGNRALTPTRISPSERSEFAARVSDRATSATAELQFVLGSSRVTVNRRLRDLALVSYRIDDAECDPVEAGFQSDMSSLAQLASFADWLLVLRFVTFYTDERRALIWDRTAQRQLLRPLFLSIEDSRGWTQAERTLLELDSRRRNLADTLNREILTLSRRETSVSTETDVRAEITVLSRQIEDGEVERERLDRDLADVEESAANVSLESLRLDLIADESRRALEEARLTRVLARFPSNQESARYVFGALLADDHCLVCGNDAPEFRRLVEHRAAGHECSFCGSDISTEESDPIDLTDERAERRRIEAEAAEVELRSALAALEDLTFRANELRTAQAALDVEMRGRRNRIGHLTAQLPADEREAAESRDLVEQLRARLREMDQELGERAGAFDQMLSRHRQAIYERADELEATFEQFAREFLVERAQLGRTERSEAIGKSSYKVVFPAYELELEQAGSEVLRTRSQQGDVSESQKEFVDLAFRMALIVVAGNGKSGSIVIDTPESSLDAVFASRAAQVLGAFASAPGGQDRLVLASNLTESSMIPRLLEEMTSEGAVYSIVDLRAIARPTGAVAALGDEYDAAFDALVGRYLD